MKAFICLAFACGLLMSCESRKANKQQPSNSADQEFEWADLLKNMDLSSGAIIVTPDQSIQDAIHEAGDGDLILVTAGFYDEKLESEEKRLRIVALPGPDGKMAKIRKTRGVSIEEALKIPDEKAASDFTLKRKELGEGIAHYTFDVPMGPGKYEIVRIHRVVKESEPYKPVSTGGNVFMVHGAIQDFNDIFLTGGALEVNAHSSAPFYLANRGIDVWGIDLAWNRVPMDCTDFSFMEGWGVEKDMDHVLKAMSIARLVRGLTVQGYGKMNLLGFSYGVSVAYGGAGFETQQHPVCRDISGIIPVDSYFKYGPGNQELKEENCMAAAMDKKKLDEGIFQHPWGTQFINLGTMALNDPDGTTPIPDYQPLSNTQVLLALSTMHTSFHFLGGTLQEGLFYSDLQRFIRMSVELAPYQPRQSLFEMNACGCDSPEFEVGFDDYLAEITIPILYLAAGGGAPDGAYTARELTGTEDLSVEIIQMEGREAVTDFGHADLWLGNEAADLVWAKLFEWLTTH